MHALPSRAAVRRGALLPAAAAVVALTVLAWLLPALPAVAETGRVLHVAPTGADTDPGTAEAPFATLARGLAAVGPGDTLLVRGGTYPERITSVVVTAGRADARVQVRAYPGERPVVQGLLWLKGASYWDISGINVTWGESNTSTEHMVKLTGGTGWTFTDAEVWGARSYAGILVAGDATGWTIARNHVHDTYLSNSTNQDHLIYANSGTGGGVIERNLLVGSANGRAVKVGPPTATSGPVSDVVIRYNTMVDNLGPSNVQVAFDTSRTRVERNVMVRPAANRSAVTAFKLTGVDNVVVDNVVWEAARPLDTGVAGLVDGGGNLMRDPMFAAPALGDYQPLDPVAALYGHTAPSTTVTTEPSPTGEASPTTSPSPSSEPSPSPTAEASPTTSPSPSPEASPSPTAEPSPTAAAGITLSGVATATNNTGTSLQLARPAGTAPGDVLVAAVSARRRPTVAAPAGWALLTTTDNDKTMRTSLYWRTATDGDPGSWSWSFSSAVAATGSLVAYSGVDAVSPMAAYAGRAGASSTHITAPSVDAPEGGLVLALSATAVQTTVTADQHAVELGEVTTTSGKEKITSHVAAFAVTAAGSTGTRTAVARHAAVNTGHLVALRPAG